jgi:hypothetical protein
VKKFARKVKKSITPLYLVPVVLVAVLIVLGIVIFGGGDEGKEKTVDAPRGFAQGQSKQSPGAKRRRPKMAPVVRTGTLDEARRSGRLAVAQARGTIVAPTRVRIRVSAAPKQVVSVNWQLGCFKNRRAVVGRDSYRTRPPDIREIKLPTQGAKSCIATASAQLTKPDGVGRVRVSVVAG